MVQQGSIMNIEQKAESYAPLTIEEALEYFNAVLASEGWRIEDMGGYWKLSQPQPASWAINIRFSYFSETVGYCIRRARPAWKQRAINVLEEPNREPL